MKKRIKLPAQFSHATASFSQLNADNLRTRESYGNSLEEKLSQAKPQKKHSSASCTKNYVATLT